MEKYQVKGMSCAACQSAVEKAVKKSSRREILFGFFIDEFNGSRGECQS